MFMLFSSYTCLFCSTVLSSVFSVYWQKNGASTLTFPCCENEMHVPYLDRKQKFRTVRNVPTGPLTLTLPR